MYLATNYKLGGIYKWQKQHKNGSFHHSFSVKHIAQIL